MNVIGFDDGPFPREHRGDVLLVGAVCAGTRLDGVLASHVRRDGADATRRVIDAIRGSQFVTQVQAILFQGIAMGGFNVVDIQGLHREMGVPVLVVMRRSPDMLGVERALFSGAPPGRPRVKGAARKWGLIQAAGAIEPLGRTSRTRATGLRGEGPRLWVQRAGLTMEEARRLVAATTLHGNVPEPVRLAHLIAGGIVTGKSRGRA